MIAIAAVANNAAIGIQGRIPWNLPSDMHHFRELTTGYTVVMGRKTFESLPNGALPGRRNIVISKRSNYSASGAEIIHSIDKLFQTVSLENAFVIGGSEIYHLLLPLCSKIYLTRVFADYPEADTHFPSIEQWKLTGQSEIMEENGIRFRFQTYIKE